MFCPVPGEIPALQTPGEAAFIVQAVLLLGPWDPALADIPPTLHSPRSHARLISSPWNKPWISEAITAQFCPSGG